MRTSRFVSLAMKGLLASIGAVIYFSSSAHAATITVTTTDMTGSPGDCALPDAVEAANTNAAVNACAAGDPEPNVDSITIPAGTYDDVGLYPTESVRFVGASMNSTILNNTTLIPDCRYDSSRLEVRSLTINDGYIRIDTLNDEQHLAHFVMDHIQLSATIVQVRQYTAPVATAITNMRATDASSIDLDSNVVSAGNTLIENSEMVGSGEGSGAAVYHMSQLANERVDIKNSTITDYDIGLFNYECTAEFGLASMYITNSMVGGGAMRVGAVNQCGHLVINKTTFHDITGTAILAWANYQPIRNEECYKQSSSKIEVYNSTFSGIDVSGLYPIFSGTQDVPETLYPGIITLDSQLRSTCTTNQASQTTDTDLILVHNTFAGNTFTNANSGVFGTTDGTVLRNLRFQNNAMQGRALSGDFSVSGGTTAVANNVTTMAYNGPAAFAAGFMTVANFLLGPLQDNGGSRTGINQAGGRVLTMRPLAGSPLIDAASSVGLSDDQRGAGRSTMARYDAGAVEVTLAEYTADGGVYTPETDDGSASEPGRLAETGEGWFAATAIGLGLAAGGLALATVVTKR